MYLIINKCVTAVKVSNFSGHYLLNRSTLDIGVLGYIGILQHKEHSPEVWHIPPVTLCICRSAAKGNHPQHVSAIKSIFRLNRTILGSIYYSATCVTNVLFYIMYVICLQFFVKSVN